MVFCFSLLAVSSVIRPASRAWSRVISSLVLGLVMIIAFLRTLVLTLLWRRREGERYLIDFVYERVRTSHFRNEFKLSKESPQYPVSRNITMLPKYFTTPSTTCTRFSTRSLRHISSSRNRPLPTTNRRPQLLPSLIRNHI